MAYGFETDKSKYVIPKKTLNFSTSGGLVESWAAPFNYISANAYINGGTIEMLMKFSQSAFTAKEGRMLKIREPYRPGMNYAVGLILTAAKPYTPVGSIWIGADGNLEYYMSSVPAAGCYFHIVYPCGA